MCVPWLQYGVAYVALSMFVPLLRVVRHLNRTRSPAPKSTTISWLPCCIPQCLSAYRAAANTKPVPLCYFVPSAGLRVLCRSKNTAQRIPSSPLCALAMRASQGQDGGGHRVHGNHAQSEPVCLTPGT